MTDVAVVIGAGAGLSASLARRLSERGMRVLLAARSVADLEGLQAETGAEAMACDAGEPEEVAALFERADAMGDLAVAVYNPSARSRGPIATLSPEDGWRALRVTAFGAFVMAGEAARRMEPRGRGAMLFTGASAGVKGFANSAPFAMGKFALRGLCQSLARELHPKGIHVGHVVIDGAIGEDEGDARLRPDAIADAYVHLLDQHRSAWAWEVELRPWTERF